MRNHPVLGARCADHRAACFVTGAVSSSSWNAGVFAERGLDLRSCRTTTAARRRTRLCGLHYQLNQPQESWSVSSRIRLRRCRESCGVRRPRSASGREWSCRRSSTGWSRVPPVRAWILVLSESADFPKVHHGVRARRRAGAHGTIPTSASSGRSRAGFADVVGEDQTACRLSESSDVSAEGSARRAPGQVGEALVRAVPPDATLDGLLARSSTSYGG